MESSRQILVCFADNVSLGYVFERKRNSWPLHVTLVGWFSSSDDKKVTQALADVAASFSGFNAEVGQEEQFGDNAVVNLMKDQTPFLRLHNNLSEAVIKNGGIVEEDRFTGKNKIAHITQHAENRKYEGDRLVVNDFYRVCINSDNMCEVTDQFMFGSQVQA
jgi:hypothetical protein